MKTGKLTLMVLLTISAVSSINAQDSLAIPSEKEFAFNCLPLATSFLPYDSNPVLNVNDFSLILKNKKEFSNRYNRTSLALFIDSDENIFSLNKLLIKRGVEKKKPLSKMWVFHYGSELFLGLTESSQFSTRGEFGLAGIYGMQCMLNERIGLGTEGYAEVSLVSDSFESGFNFKLRLPRTLLLSIFF